MKYMAIAILMLSALLASAQQTITAKVLSVTTLYGEDFVPAELINIDHYYAGYSIAVKTQGRVIHATCTTDSWEVNFEGFVTRINGEKEVKGLQACVYGFHPGETVTFQVKDGVLTPLRWQGITGSYQPNKYHRAGYIVVSE